LTIVFTKSKKNRPIAQMGKRVGEASNSHEKMKKKNKKKYKRRQKLDVSPSKNLRKRSND
jgi:hypothetical protein